MDVARSLIDRIKTAAILLAGVLPLALQPGPVAGEAVASRHVNRLLDELPEGDGELPNELALQCHLISLVSDAVTLRAITDTSDNLDRPSDDEAAGSSLGAESLTPTTTCAVDLRLPADPAGLSSRSKSPAQPRGP